jgi:hypothetical protein
MQETGAAKCPTLKIPDLSRLLATKEKLATDETRMHTDRKSAQDEPDDPPAGVIRPIDRFVRL